LTRFLCGCLLCLLIFQFASAAAQADTSANLSRLAFEHGWLKLVHYEPDSSSSTGWRSAIHSSDFFLDAGGKIDPLLELKATLAAFVASAANPDQHAQCRFPARWQWLKARLGDAHPAFRTAIKCPAFDTWTRSGSVSSLSIVFATGYLENPASYYGHTLLKFNFRGDQEQSSLMDVSVNYGAIVEKNDGPISYIVKSLVGGYDGGFSHIHFYFFNHNYGENELRDLWEYKLDLPQNAVDLIVAHAWEVLGKRYTYHFFRYNCAYRMAEILQVVDGVEIIPEHTPWIIPQAMIEKVGVVKYQGKPLLAGVTYLPSRQSRFYEKYLSLSQQEASLLEDLVAGRHSLDEQTFQGLSTLTKQALLDTLLDYYQFVGNPLDNAPKKTRQEYTKALSARYQLEAGSPEVRSLQPLSPHLGRPIGWVQAGWGHNNVTGNVLSIRFRPAYYDVLDTGIGQVRNAALIMGDTQLNISHGRAYINKLDLIGVESVNPGLTGLPGDNGAAWKLHIGAEQQGLSCDDCIVARVQGDMGYGRQWHESLFSAVYVGGALQSNHADQGIGYAKTSVNLILRQGNHFGVKLNYDQRFPVGIKLGSYGVTDLEGRWSINTRGDFRISYKHDDAELLSMGIGMYW
jgi:Domain of unknown function (DUF4105)